MIKDPDLQRAHTPQSTETLQERQVGQCSTAQKYFAPRASVGKLRSEHPGLPSAATHSPSQLTCMDPAAGGGPQEGKLMQLI